MIFVWSVFFFTRYVELNRSAFLEPEVLPKPRKSLFIKQKLTVSVGEIVHGGPLPPVVHHIPICSFNGQNKYTGGTTTVESAGSSQKASIDMKGKSNSWTLLMFYCSKMPWYSISQWGWGARFL